MNSEKRAENCQLESVEERSDTSQAQVVTNICSEINERFLKGIPISNLLGQENATDNPELSKFFSLITGQNPSLSNIDVCYISPKDELETGGYFNLIEGEEGDFVPTIFIMSGQGDHMKKLMKNRRSSAEMAAHMLGISFKNMTPRLLELFIIAHELGHAIDYINNYELNPDYKGTSVVEEWNNHYEANLLSLPVNGLDPAELRREIENFSNLEEFLRKFPDCRIDSKKIKTLDGLLHEQEIAYRSSPYESYADNFAIDFLKRNARELKISALLEREIELAA